jgi:two-component system, NtrC family, response regulator AtoC
MTGRILIVDDDASMCAMLKQHLSRRGHTVTTHTDAALAFEALRAADFDAVITDLNMRGMDGLALCERIVADRRDVPVVVITAFGSLDSAIAAIRAGAYDFVPKPFAIDQLLIALERALQHRALQVEVTRLRRVAAAAVGLEDLIGESAAMRRVYDLLERVRESDASVLITGESGTGKELVARALHRGSRRAAGPFVAVNCAAMPDTLLESELFGHVRGAFTDARTTRTGLFVQASGGTLLLDEIGEMPLDLQPKLLRFLESREIHPIGESRPTTVDVRIMAATNADLDALVAQGRFREDLYYRLNIVPLHLPPLRERRVEIPALATHYLQTYAREGRKGQLRLAEDTVEYLVLYRWPGNVRQLANEMRRLAVLAEPDAVLMPEHLSPEIAASRRTVPPSERMLDPTELVVRLDQPLAAAVEHLERALVQNALHLAGGRVEEAAARLGLSRKGLYLKRQRFGLLAAPAMAQGPAA